MKLKILISKFFLTTLLLITNSFFIFGQKNDIEKKLIGKWCLIKDNQITCETLPVYYNKCEGSITFDSLMRCYGLFGNQKNNVGIWSINNNNLIIKTEIDTYNHKIHFINDTTFRIIYIFCHYQDSNRTFSKQ
jgi:hypothetical protein